MADTPIFPVDLGTILVIGGRGFLGYHIIVALQSEPSIICSAIHVLSRSPNDNHIPGVTYHNGDITSDNTVSSLLSQVRPQIIFHCASPAAYYPGANASFFQRNIVDGTATIVSAATKAPSVLGLIYTSTSMVVAGASFVRATESSPILTQSSRSNAYCKAKAKADALVLASNNPLLPEAAAVTAAVTNYAGTLRTLVLRPPAMYGERDPVVIGGLLASFRAGETRYQLGDGSNLFDWLHVVNAASAHVLAVRALVVGALHPSFPTAKKVDGEAFFISDDHPLPFWDFVHRVWAEMGDTTPSKKRIVVPRWAALTIGSTVEWIVWLASVGKTKPTLLNRQRMEYSVLEHTICVDKAKERLGYEPVVGWEEGVRKGVEWALKNEKTKLS